LPTLSGESCGACLASPPPFDAAVTAFDYRFPLDRLVQRFKFSGDLAIGAYLGRALAAAVITTPRPDLILASPASAARIRERGFNQALVLARSVAARVGVALEPATVRKIRHTPPQAGLDRQERRRNLRQAFECHRRLDGLHVALVDDVMTTGSTLAAVAAELKRAGAVRVSGWVLARTPSPDSGS
jgi:ComF family protein